MERRTWAVDAGIAGLALGLTLGVLAMGGFGRPDPGSRTVDALGVALAVTAAAPLVARRVVPLTVYAVTAAAAVTLIYLRYPFELPLGPVIAGYTVAATYSGGGAAARRWSARLAVAMFVPLITIAYGLAGVNIETITSGLLLWAVVFVGVWLGGDRSRLQHEQITVLEEQARRTLREAERERRLAVAEERTRIARELHDSAGHAINVILVQAGAARLLHTRDPAGSRRAIGTIEDVARSTIGEIDRLVRVLREGEPPAMPTPEDPGALEQLLKRHRADGLTIAADIVGQPRALPHGVAWAAYRILQEALTNAARHGAGTADVALSFGPAAVEITVTNPTVSNGVRDGGGHGIIGMRERATLLAGTFAAAADDGVFRLHTRLPITDAAS
ncbi:sensor histidine kinase [Acrocarpospora macrocephala]|uniref:sensor histidine kinase n=1 Tax=Acrocarpospora macrocephala TaxID=150177 RepID=UPI001C3FC37B|nr:histidine kinase [Acrocarpospora macrocephala]